MLREVIPALTESDNLSKEELDLQPLSKKELYLQPPSISSAEDPVASPYLSLPF